MKITKERLKQLIKEEIDIMAEREEGFLTDPNYGPDDYAAPEELPSEQTKETLVARLQDLLHDWPACEDDPNGVACQYHKDLEDVVLEYGGEGCGALAHQKGGEVGVPNAPVSPITPMVTEE